MIDFANIEKYKENNRIEAKKALGGLPLSIWETYSAFANTYGGIILLGVQEYRDKTFHTVNLLRAEEYVQEIWKIINNPKKVSSNILSKKDVTIEKVNGCNIIAIRVPKAQRIDKPVYIDNDYFNGSYRRSGEGDYRCTKDEVLAMIRDASIKTQDMQVLENFGIDVINYASVRSYRERIKINRPGHILENLSDNEFLYNLGAVGKTADGVMHPTAAGLLMFGYASDILKQYPSYYLEYNEVTGKDDITGTKITSLSNDWSGNVYDFYFQVYEQISEIVKEFVDLKDGEAVEDVAIHKALREALANCLINADYYSKNGIIITKNKDNIVFSNPGAFRIDIEDAKAGGISDSRNSELIKIFNLINISESTGSGIPNIFSIWKNQGWMAPIIEESFDPDRINITLYFKSGENNLNNKISDKKRVIKTAIYRDMILSYLTKNITASSFEISEFIRISDLLTKMILEKMIKDGIVITENIDDNLVYKLKE